MLKKLTIAVLSLLLTFTMIACGESGGIGGKDGFTVKIDQNNEYGKYLTLSETRTFESSVKGLNYAAVGGISDTSKNSLPGDLDGDNGGKHHGKNYLAFTFFLKNTGKNNLSCRYEFFLSEMTNNIQDALRVRVYINNDGEYNDGVDYAEVASNGQPEPETKAFLTESIVTAAVLDLQPDGIKRFTIVIWLEGDDPDCTDDILGGEVAFKMDLSVLSMG